MNSNNSREKIFTSRCDPSGQKSSYTSSAQPIPVSRPGTLVEHSMRERLFDPRLDSTILAFAEKPIWNSSENSYRIENQLKTPSTKDILQEEHDLPRCEDAFKEKGPNCSYKNVSNSPEWRRSRLGINSLDQPAPKTITNAFTFDKRHTKARSGALVNRENRSLENDSGVHFHDIQIFDPCVILSRISAEVDREMKKSKLVVRALLSEDWEFVERVLRRQYIQRNTFFKTWPELERAILEMRSLDLQEETENLRESLMCAKCHQRKVSVLLLPCGHRKCCTICAMRIEKCVVCNEFIGERIPWSYNAAPTQSPV